MRSDLEVSDILDNEICRMKKLDRPIGKATVICLPEANPEFFGVAPENWLRERVDPRAPLPTCQRYIFWRPTNRLAGNFEIGTLI